MWDGTGQQFFLGHLQKAYPSITCIKGIARNFSEFETSSVKKLFSDNYYELEKDIYFLFDFTCVKKQERAVKSFGKGVSPVLQQYIGEIRFL